MASSDPGSPSDGAETIGPTLDDATLPPLTSSQDGEEFRQTEDANVTDMRAEDGEKPAAPEIDGFANEIKALKIKLLELERRAQDNPAAVKEDAARRQLMIDREEYRRMEDCLKKHRKEWERAGGPNRWGIMDRFARFYMENGYFETHGEPEFKVNWDYMSSPSYEPPSLLELSRNVADGEGQGGTDTYDEFDEIIDYGSRRTRLRKNFEWEMDRIYLAEELEQRRKEKIKAAKVQDLGGTEPEAHHKEDEQTGDAGPAPPKFAQPQLNRLDWSGFRLLAQVEEKDAFAVDILTGEPNVDDELAAYRHWYGFSSPVRKRDTPPDPKAVASMLPGQPQLPERLRIHSEALTTILRIILGKEWDGKTVVFIRPFKALAYCERALRDWCAALEKKFEAAPETNKDAPAADDGSAGGPLRENAALQDEPVEGPGESDASEKLASEVAEKPEGKDNQTEDDPGDVTKSPTALAHLRCLLSFVDSDILAKQAYLKGPDCRKVFFSDLWQLFRPGIEVTGSDGKQAYLVISVTSAKHRVASPWERWSNVSEKRKKRAPPFSVTCVYIDFDGENLGPVHKIFDFKKFDGERDITSLEVYPLRFHPLKRGDFADSEWKELGGLPATERYRQKLIRRGAKFLDVAGVKHMYYAGPTLERRDEVDSQVVIDFETTFSAEDPAQKQWKPELKTMIGNPEAGDSDPDAEDKPCSAICCRNDNVHDDSYVDGKQRQEYINSLLPKAGNMNEQPSIAIIPRPLKELRTSNGSSLVSDNELVIMSYRVFGFVLRTRQWAKLDLAHLTDVHCSAAEGDKDQQDGTGKNKGTTAFDRLVLEEWHRPIILALIAQHFRDKKSTVSQREEFDIVKGKGKGLILLLHGAPGVGKTSTAEGVAELFKKPLFQITCGDLGTTAEEVEKALETNFALASRWDCILLLDEADVFLAERTKLDFKRNGLVAVFLRVMEYYTGILFLTTNRIGDFDEAFTSRIHVSLYYPELDSDKTVKVFKLNMLMIQERFASKGRKIDIDEMGIGGFATQHFTTYPHARWNGRQIRNACQTALALAEFEAQGKSHHDILRPDAVVKLGVSQFEIVRDAYLKFARYMNKLYGTNVARRAKDAKVRAIWVDENDNVLADSGAGGMSMDKMAFGAASKVQPRPAQEQHYSYQNGSVPHPNYISASHMPPAQAGQFLPSGQSWEIPGMKAAGANVNANVNTNAPDQGSWQRQNEGLTPRQPPSVGGQHYDPQQQQRQTSAYPAVFDQGIQDMYTASGLQAPEQLPPGNVPPASGNNYRQGAAAPGQQWRGAPSLR